MNKPVHVFDGCNGVESRRVCDEKHDQNEDRHRHVHTSQDSEIT